MLYMSFLRRQESMLIYLEIPAFAGMTIKNYFTIIVLYLSYNQLVSFK